MATPIVVTRYNLRAGSPMARNPSCGGGGVPTSYIVQSFGVDIAQVDIYDAISGLRASEAMQGMQNFEDSDSFREHSFIRISYTGTNLKDTDGDVIYKGQEEHTSSWGDESLIGWI